MSEWINNECMTELVNECVNEWMSKWMDGWKKMHVLVNEWEGMDEWKNEWMNEWVKDWMSEWMNKTRTKLHGVLVDWRTKRNEWLDAWTMEWMNEWVDTCHYWMNGQKNWQHKGKVCMVQSEANFRIGMHDLFNVWMYTLYRWMDQSMGNDFRIQSHIDV